MNLAGDDNTAFHSLILKSWAILGNLTSMDENHFVK